jgi:hypothetical protein
MKKLIVICAVLTMILASSGVSVAAINNVTGDPGADGFTLVGNSLENGIYVRGGGNYGYNAYIAGFNIQSGANLVSATWQVGDTVLAVGGTFTSITAAEAGWSAFSGGAVNALLSNSTGPKLQAKFGNSAAAWTTSTVAPGGGNGLGSLSYGDGDLVDGVAIQIRTGTYYPTNGPAFVPGQDQAGTLGWNTNVDLLMHLGKNSYAEQTASMTLGRDVGRVIWTDISATGEPTSWELLLNVSLVGRLNPTFAGLLPAIGDNVLMTVQDNDSSSGYTDALVVVPEPATMLLLGLGAVLLRKKK